MRMCAHGRQMMVTGTSKQPTFGPVSFITYFLLLNSILICQYNISLLASSFQAG